MYLGLYQARFILFPQALHETLLLSPPPNFTEESLRPRGFDKQDLRQTRLVQPAVGPPPHPLSGPALPRKGQLRTWADSGGRDQGGPCSSTEASEPPPATTGNFRELAGWATRHL